MDNFFELFKSISNLNSKENYTTKNEIPKEIKDQYPYGEFPIKYTKNGQEKIRIQSENRFSYSEEQKQQQNNGSLEQLNLFIPLIQMMTNKKEPKDMLQIFGKLLFKDNPELQKLFSLMPKIKSQEINNNQAFPNTNKINISSLKKID